MGNLVLGQWAYPDKCALCALLGEPAVCSSCASELGFLKLSEEDAGPDPVTLGVACWDYTGRAAQAVKRLKYARVLTHVPFMAEQVLETAMSSGMLECDAFVPVPIHWSRRCERGFNQAELLAENLPQVEPRWLKRIRRTRQQVGLSPEMRLRNLSGAFSASGEVLGKHIVLVDDVTTSGGTAKECARALLSAGALRVDLLTCCRGGAAADL